jgi:2-polyprenyl-3-methyl-5-hydroxy-6-metoxy-1,4-benzoquinol methylase
MTDVVTYTNCPVCNGSNIGEVLCVKDFTVSQKSFSIWQCNDCTCRFTQNAPAPNRIGNYYRSSAYVSHSDTKKGLINNLYHTVRNHTLEQKRRLIEKVSVKNKGSLLDVGAGTGAFAAVMQKAGWGITGLEPDETARKNALKNHQLQLQTLDTLYAFNDTQFDVITLWHVLEHVHELHAYVETFYRILNDAGTLIVAVPNFTSADAATYKEFWAAYDVPRHVYHFSPVSMQQLMQQHNFKIMQYKPMWFDSFYVAMLSEQYKTGHNHLVRAVWNGFVSNVEAIRDTKKCSSIIYVMKKEKEK